MSGTPTPVTFSSGVAQVVSTPTVLESLLITAYADAVKITVYDTADLNVRPLASATVVGVFTVPLGTSDSFYLCARIYHGIYMVLNAGTSPTVTVYIP